MSLARRLSSLLPGRLAFEANRLRRRIAPSPRQRRDLALLEAMGHPQAIMQGPFKGMKYVPVVAAVDLVTDLLGIYELELRESVERLVAHRPDLVVDVGTASGYYAVGMALRVPAARVVGFDINSYARAVTRRVAALNGVNRRVEVRGACTPPELESLLASARRPVVISDCEGYEDVLLDPAKVPALRTVPMLVELHDMFVPGVSQRLRERFEPTHDIRAIQPRLRTKDDLPPSVKFTEEQAAKVLGTKRNEDSFWYELTPRSS